MNLRQRFSILRRLHRKAEFASPDDHAEFQAKLADLLKRGVLEVVPINTKHQSSLFDDEAWIRDKRTGVIYSYVAPDWPSVGHWAPVEKPEVPSFFESLFDDIYPTPEQYRQLVAALDQAWAAGEIEAAQHPQSSPDQPEVFFHHAKNDESYNLMLPTDEIPKAAWMKVYHSKKDGTWPGELVIGPPPWRRLKEVR